MRGYSNTLGDVVIARISLESLKDSRYKQMSSVSSKNLRLIGSFEYYVKNWAVIKMK